MCAGVERARQRRAGAVFQSAPAPFKLAAHSWLALPFFSEFVSFNRINPLIRIMFDWIK